MMADLQHEAFKLRSNNLGIQVTRQVKKSLGLKDRKVEKGPFYVLARAGMPAVLVEVAFISNPKEEAKLKTSRFRQQVAEAICRAVMDYKKLVESTAVAKK
jgi:N-acetylmuramoyl-L-alanine amidase